MEQKHRELNLEKANMQAAEIPKTGNQTSIKVTKSEDDLDLGGSLKDQKKPLSMDEHCGKPGELSQWDIVDDTGIDCTREPDWQVVKSDNLPEKPEPNQVHNDKYWDERSLDQQLEERPAEEMIRKEMEDFDRAERETIREGLFRMKCSIPTMEAILHQNQSAPRIAWILLFNLLAVSNLCRKKSEDGSS